MRDPFAGYDAWLERPYQDMMEESDKFYDWAEEAGFDMEDPEEVKRAEEAYADYWESMAEAEAEDAYERAMEARYDAMMEREWAGEDAY